MHFVVAKTKIKHTCNLVTLDLTRLGVWVLDGDPGHGNLLKYALNEKNFPHTLVILTVSMTTPWSWQEQLDHWTTILREHVEKLNLSPGMIEFLNRTGHFFKSEVHSFRPMLGMGQSNALASLHYVSFIAKCGP